MEAQDASVAPLPPLFILRASARSHRAPVMDGPIAHVCHDAYHQARPLSPETRKTLSTTPHVLQGVDVHAGMLARYAACSAVPHSTTDHWKGAAMHPPRRDRVEIGADREAAYARFVALVPQHMDAIVRVAAALIGASDAEDAAQEAVVRAWRAWPALRDPGAMRSWLLRITVNVCRDWWRGDFGARQRLTESLDDGAEGFATIAVDLDACDLAAALDLRQAVNRLEGDLRLVVALRYYAGMDATEIGAALGIPPATVRTRLRRALHTLRDRLQVAEEPPVVSPRKGDR